MPGAHRMSKHGLKMANAAKCCDTERDRAISLKAFDFADLYGRNGVGWANVQFSNFSQAQQHS